MAHSKDNLKQKQNFPPVKPVEENSLKAKGSTASPFFLDFVAPLAVRDFRLLVSGQMISTLGDAFYEIALPWLLLTLGNAQDLGIILAAYGIPRVITILIGGVLSDRLRPRRVMLFADVMRAIFVGLLALVIAQERPPMWQIAVLAAGLGAFTGLFRPAYFAITPELLPDNLLQAGNAVNTSSLMIASMIGPVIGGILVSQLNSTGVLLLDMFSFILSAITLSLMQGGRGAAMPLRKTLTEPTTATPEKEAEASTLGQLFRTSRLLQVMLVIVVIANLTWGGMMEVALPALVLGPLAARALDYGVILAAAAAGAVIGALGASQLGRLPQRGVIALLLGIFQAIAFATIPFVESTSGAAVILAAIGVANSLTNVTLITLVQQQIPRALLGRTMAVIQFASYSLFPISVALAGFASEHFGPSIMFWISSAGLLTAFSIGLFQRELRNPGVMTER